MTGTSAAAPLAASDEGRTSLRELRERLAQQRGRIRSLDLDVTTEVVHADPLASAELATLAGRSRLRYQAGELRLARGSGAGFSVTAVGSGSEQPGWFRSTSTVTRRRPGLSLQQFLPVLRDRPMYDLGVREVDGRRLRLVGQDDVHYLVDESVPAVVGVDVFVTADEVGETIRYEDYRHTRDGVLFPHRIVVRRLAGNRETACLRASVVS